MYLIDATALWKDATQESRIRNVVAGLCLPCNIF